MQNVNEIGVGDCIFDSSSNADHRGESIIELMPARAPTFYVVATEGDDRTHSPHVGANLCQTVA